MLRRIRVDELTVAIPGATEPHRVPIMHILVISNLYPPAIRGGYEVLCAETVKRLRQHHRVRVLTSRAPGAPPEPDVDRELELLTPGKRGALRAPLAALRAARATRRLIRACRPDLIFVWNGAEVPHAAIRVAEYSGAPVAYSVAQHWFGGLHQRDQFMRHLEPGDRGLRALWARVARLVNRHPDLLLETGRRVPASICWVSDALRRGVDVPETVEPLVERVIYTGIHEPDVWIDLERPPASDPPTIAFVGRLEEQKGPSVAYRALAALRDRHSIDAQLKLAGRGTPSELLLLDRLARELDIEDRVELLGQVDQAAVGRLMAAASAIVVPSVWQEPSGGVCLEAGLARVPVVASRSGGMPEGLLEEEHALYFPIGEADACADTLARVLTETRETQARTGRAFDRARQFSFDNYMAQMDDFITAAVAAHNSRGQHQDVDARRHLRRPLGSPARRSKATN
jgi:glycosyltransferase involved in cell wall biosynthesis